MMKNRVTAFFLTAIMALAPVTVLAAAASNMPEFQAEETTAEDDVFDDTEDDITAKSETTSAGTTCFLTVSLTKGGAIILNKDEVDEQTIKIVTYGNDAFVDVYDKDNTLIKSISAEENNYSYLYESEPSQITIAVAAEDGYQLTDFTVSNDSETGFSAPADSYRYSLYLREDTVVSAKFAEASSENAENIVISGEMAQGSDENMGSETADVSAADDMLSINPDSTEEVLVTASTAVGNIKIVKSAVGSLSVTGAGYGIYTDSECINAVDALWIGTAGSNYDISIDLPLGTYYVKEFYAPDGYALDTQVYKRTLSKAGQTLLVYSVEPTATPTPTPTPVQTGQIKVLKVSNSSAPITGAGYGVYTDSECQNAVDALWIGTTSTNTDISIDLPLGMYYIKEFYAPNGYSLDTSVHKAEISTQGQIVTVTSIEATLTPTPTISADTVTLCYPDGTTYDEVDQGTKFPSCYSDEYNVLGWSENQHDVYENGTKITTDYYMEDETIPINGINKYYMVAYDEGEVLSSIPDTVYSPDDGTVVYFVGDSRTVHIKNNLQARTPYTFGKSPILSLDDVLATGNGTSPLDKKLVFIAQEGEGITWFKNTGLSQLKSKLVENANKKNIVIFNLGVNDCGSTTKSNQYVSYFTSLAKELKTNYYCSELYYANIYPINFSAMKAVDSENNDPQVSMQRVINFNNLISPLWNSGTYKEIKLFEYLRENGWEYNNENTMAKGDGIHPSWGTALKLYNYCMKEIGCTKTVNVK